MLNKKSKETHNNRFYSGSEPVIRTAIQDLLKYCESSNWAGYDPYDGLNSHVLKNLPLTDNRIVRLAVTQAMKRLPFNLRKILLVPKGENPKGLAVFCSALINLSEADMISNNDERITLLLERMINLRSPNIPHYCWGYNFDWQSRGGLLPKFSPTIIGTTFSGNALLDEYYHVKETKYLNMALSAGQFILTGLNKSGSNENELCFSYTQYDGEQVHNANLLGAAYIARLYSLTGEKRYLDAACKSVQFSINRQNADGSWPYGEYKEQKWIDNFHTGYNLIALKRFSEFTGINDYNENITKGFNYYRENFFTDLGLPKYYHNSLYPIDIHCVAQSIITLVEFRYLDESNIDLALKIFSWAEKEMKSKEGYFYYQMKRHYINKIPYIRWSQAWMLYSLSILQREILSGKEPAMKKAS